jgi:hypothetical protein
MQREGGSGFLGERAAACLVRVADDDRVEDRACVLDA